MLAIDRAADTWQRNEDYHYWSQFSRLVDRGATVIQTTESDDEALMSTAFRNPDGAIVVVVLNSASG